METESDQLNPTAEMKSAQLNRWQGAGRRPSREMRTLCEVLRGWPGADDQEAILALWEARILLLGKRAYLGRLFSVDFSEAARAEFEGRYYSFPDDWTVTMKGGQPAYQLHPHNFPDIDEMDINLIDP